MSVLIISYDLANPAQNRGALLKKIKSYGQWARLGSSAYLVASDAGPVAVRDDLSSVLETNDKLFVGVAPAPSAWQGMSDAVSKWILAHQK